MQKTCNVKVRKNCYLSGTVTYETIQCNKNEKAILMWGNAPEIKNCAFSIWLDTISNWKQEEVKDISVTFKTYKK